MNWLIRILTFFAPKIDGNPLEWKERDYHLLDNLWREFLCGSVKGIYRFRDNEFQVLAVHNTKKNNHFDIVLEWFENSCKRDKCSLSFLEVGNPKLKQKLERLGFNGTKDKMVKNY